MKTIVFVPKWNRDFSLMCEACGNVAYHRHHIYYGRSAIISLLCIPCHEMITKVNSEAGWTKKAPLTITERVWLFNRFLGHMPIADEINWNSKLG